MPLAHDEIVSASRDVIQRFSQRLEFAGVMASEGGSDRVELMVTISGCHDEPCRLMFNLPRADGPTFEAELRQKLEQQLRSHTTPA